MVEVPGVEHFPWVGDQAAILDEVQRFVTALGEVEAELERSLATVVFTDVVGSTETAAQLGDRRWKELLEEHHRRVRGQLARFRGVEVDTAGDGFLATFDGPARAVRCATAIVQAVAALGVEVRAGVHTGEVETIDGKVGGMGVVIGARVGALAGASQVLVSQTVKDLVAGSGLVFEDAGEHELKGVPDRWRLYRVVDR
jgi:class 3 adenylate cyclase